jgi:flagellar protein FlaJ
LKGIDFDLHGFGYRMLGSFPSRIYPGMDGLRTSLARGRFRISPIVYISSAFFWSLLSIIATGIIAYPAAAFLTSLKVLQLSEIQILEVGVGAPLLIGALVAVIFLYYPTSRSDTEKMEINKNLVYIINYMGVLAGAGITTEDIFSSLAVGGEVYKISESAKTIVRDIGLLGKDVLTAIDDEAKVTPSKKYSKLLVGLIGVNKNGSDLKDYFSEIAENEMEVRRRELGDLVNKLNLAAEIYTVLGVAFPIIMIVLLSLMGIFGGEVMGGLGPIDMIKIMSYVLFPLVSIGLILFIDGLTSSW